jgi:hypothetical protein
MPHQTPCRFRRHDLRAGAVVIELVRNGRIIGVIRRGSFHEAFRIERWDTSLPDLWADQGDDLERCTKRAGGLAQ